jgi:hypothetical protein
MRKLNNLLFLYIQKIEIMDLKATLINISESINNFLAAAARGGGRSVTAGSNVPFIDRIGVDPKLGKRMNGDFAAGDGVNGTYTG